MKSNDHFFILIPSVQKQLFFNFNSSYNHIQIELIRILLSGLCKQQRLFTDTINIFVWDKVSMNQRRRCKNVNKCKNGPQQRKHSISIALWSSSSSPSHLRCTLVIIIVPFHLHYPLFMTIVHWSSSSSPGHLHCQLVIINVPRSSPLSTGHH